MTLTLITFADGCALICDPSEVSDYTNGCGQTWTAEQIQMTEAEYDALPELEA